MRWLCSLPAAAALIAVAAPAGAATSVPAGIPHDVLAVAASARALPARAQFSTQLGPGLRTYLVPIPAGSSALDYSAQLRRRPGVVAAQPNTILTTAKISSPCAEAPTEQVRSIPAALNVGQNVRDTEPIAILDTGVDQTTPELGIRVRPGFNVVADTDNTDDTDGHGTEVAAAAAGSAVEGLVAGTSPRSPILPISIYNDAGQTTADWVVKGIQEAVKRGAGVINISSSSPATGNEAPSAADVQVLQLAIETAFDRGVITVAAIGNEGVTDAVIPGSLPHVLTVGSSSTLGVRDNFSNLGPWLDLVAPGANLTLPAPATVCTSGYGQANGTSFSAPEVAGGIALIRATQPKLSVSQLFDLVRQRASTPFNAAVRNDDTGFGMLDVTVGATAAPLASEPTEPDDDVYWITRDPKGHPTYLTTSRTARLTGAVSPGKDPQDVVAVQLSRGETVTASASTQNTNGLFDLSLWNRTTGKFDIGRQSEDTRQPLRDSGGLTRAPRVTYQARTTGRYYIAVSAPDTATPDDKSVSQVDIDPRIAYSLSLRKTKATAIKRTVKKKATRKK